MGSKILQGSDRRHTHRVLLVGRIWVTKHVHQITPLLENFGQTSVSFPVSPRPIRANSNPIPPGLEVSSGSVSVSVSVSGGVTVTVTKRFTLCFMKRFSNVSHLFFTVFLPNFCPVFAHSFGRCIADILALIPAFWLPVFIQQAAVVDANFERLEGLALQA